MKKTTIWILTFVLFSFALKAQKKQLSINDAVIGQWTSLMPESLSGVMPYGENDFTYVEEYKVIYKINSENGTTEQLLNLRKINEILQKNGLEPIRYFPYWDYEWLSEDLLKFKMNSSLILVDIKKGKVKGQLEGKNEFANITLSPTQNHVAYTIDNNLFVKHLHGKETAITNDGKGIVNGDGYVHRQEFGIDRGIFWAPSGNKLAFYKKDETMVADYPLVDVTKRIAAENSLKYPMIGEKSEEVKLGIYDIKTGKTVFANVTDFTPEHYLTAITWGADSKYIYIGVLNRDQNHLKLNKYNAETGAFVQTLFEEKNERYVEPEHPLYFVPGDNEKFICFSEKDGYSHLYLYTTDGKQVRQITKGKWEVNDVLGFDEQGKYVYFSATKNSPIEKNYYKASLKKGKIKKITTEKGTHDLTFSLSKGYAIDSYNSTTVPSKVSLISDKGKVIKVLVEAKNTLADYNLGKMKIGTIKSPDGKTDLYYRMITPPNFDPSKKYPVIVYVYGGPHAQMITNSWLGGASLWQQYMAQKGYIMFTLDNRGSDNRGFEFESIIHRQCGVAELQDQKAGIDFLLSKPYVDKNRIGVHGWSYGGFMTTSLMTDFPEIFKVGVAGGPVIDWKYYEVMYGERYMDTPATNPAGFQKTSLLNKAGKLKGRLMIIHGYQDPVVVPQNSIDFIRSCISKDTDIDFFLYPESEHNVRGKKRIHLMKKVTRYFDDFL